MTGSLKLVLDPPYERADSKARLFIPGDKVSGKAVLDLKTDEKVDSICAELKGKFRIQSNRGQDARSYETEMFGQRKTLFQGPFKLRASTYEYDFSFSFPEFFEHDFKEFSEEAFFPGQNKAGPHYLPPTFEEEDMRSGSCSIFYTLAIRVPKTFGVWEDKVTLHFTPCRTQSPAPLPKSSTDYATLQRKFRMSSEGIPRPLTRREAMKEAFRHQAETRTIKFSLSALVPTAIVIGKPYKVNLTLVSKGIDLGTYTPGFTIKDYSLSLRTKTDVRAPSTTWDMLCYLESFIPLCSGKLDLPLEINVPMELIGLFPSNHYYAPPSFTSWAIRRTYSLELNATVSCLGEDFKCKVHCKNVTLYSARMANHLDDPARAPNLSLVNHEELPVYEEANGIGGIRGELPPVYETTRTGTT